MIQQIWQDFLSIVQKEVGTQVVETWLKAVALERWDAREKIVYLRAPNSFVKDYLRMHHEDLFELHLGRLLNVTSLKLVFTDEQKASAPTQVKGAHLILSEQRKEGILTIPARRTEFCSVSHLSSSYTFDTFVVGPSNQLAYAAAHAIKENVGYVYNPLFIYGDSGLGKTHLLHAIGNGIKERNHHATVLYQPADRFVNEFINAIRFDKIHRFHAKYKNVDALLVDDIQFIANKEQTQEAFFHIFNVLHDSHKQIVLSSDTYPQEIKGLADRLRSRLAWGLVVDVQAPSLETKMAILKRKAHSNGMTLREDVAEFLAKRIRSNVRELEGSLIRVIAFSSLTQQPITVELAQKVLWRPRASHNRNTAVIDLDHVLRNVSDYYAYSVQDLRSNNRAKEISLARQVAMFLMKKMTNKSLSEIGSFLGRKDHSTVIHAVGKVQKYMKRNPDFQDQIQKLEEKILG
ncbi:chromosomal replication initiator protein DnaA [Candidatus Babeliales bacterium]|nr:chromosomal replication initiator protein DnaA [Candidatus Babeliales bacterium]